MFEKHPSEPGFEVESAGMFAAQIEHESKSEVCIPGHRGFCTRIDL